MFGVENAGVADNQPIFLKNDRLELLFVELSALHLHCLLHNAAQLYKKLRKLSAQCLLAYIFCMCCKIFQLVSAR